MRIGDRVTTTRGVAEYDGTVVDILESREHSDQRKNPEPVLVRVYWRLAEGRVGKASVRDYYCDHLRRVV